MRDWLFEALNWAMVAAAVIFIAGVTAAIHPGSGVNSVTSLAPEARAGAQVAQ